MGEVNVQFVVQNGVVAQALENILDTIDSLDGTLVSLNVDACEYDPIDGEVEEDNTLQCNGVVPTEAGVLLEKLGEMIQRLSGLVDSITTMLDGATVEDKEPEQEMMKQAGYQRAGTLWKLANSLADKYIEAIGGQTEAPATAPAEEAAPLPPAPAEELVVA